MICHCGKRISTKYTGLELLEIEALNLLEESLRPNSNGHGYVWFLNHCNDKLGTHFTDPSFLNWISNLIEKGYIVMDSVFIKLPDKIQ